MLIHDDDELEVFTMFFKNGFNMESKAKQRTPNKQLFHQYFRIIGHYDDFVNLKPGI